MLLESEDTFQPIDRGGEVLVHDVRKNDVGGNRAVMHGDNFTAAETTKPRSRAARLESFARDAKVVTLGLERGDGGGLIVLYVEDSVELGDLEKIVNLLGEVEQLEFAPDYGRR